MFPPANGGMNAILDKKRRNSPLFVLRKTGTGTDVPFSVRDSGHTCSVMRVKDIFGIS